MRRNELPFSKAKHKSHLRQHLLRFTLCSTQVESCLLDMLDFWCCAASPIYPHANDHFTRGVVQVDSAGIDLLLVGDSAGMVVHGHDTTLPVTVSDMMLHCQAVSRGSRRAFRIADLPFGSYESSPRQAIETAISFMKLGNMDAVKLEGRQLSVLISAGHILSICPHTSA